MGVPTKGGGQPVSFREFVTDGQAMGELFFVFLPFAALCILGLAYFVFITILIVQTLLGNAWP